ncbi:MAG TPA: GIY-YIG nuclease family protein [Candidatus Moranbacteria bacterium]|nr:GIY-YIG nuclease family protein [Candidatus Moranbacteria bacterium]
MSESILREKLNKLPAEPGVYIFRDKAGKILYIGKATNLKSRVSSYFRGTETRNHIEAMMPKVEDIKLIQTDSVLEALILESNLIKKHQPKYNIDLKDDKSFSYFMVTKEDFPKVVIVRATEINNQISNSKFLISNKIPNIKSQIKKIRNTKYDIQYTKIYGPYTSKKQMEIALKIMRKILPFHSNKQETEKGCLDFQIGLCPGPYAGAISQKDYQKNIRGIRMILEGKKKSLVKKLEKEMQILAKKHEFEKAAELRNKIFALNHIRDVALISKEFEPKIRDTKYEIRNTRIEAYDISNISGTNAVGSMVVFSGDEPDKKEYRKFKIKTVSGSNDVAMMQEVLMRRFKNNWAMPDLILLDGGQGHANMASELVIKLGLAVLVVAIAKGKTRKNLNFQFPISNKIPMSQFPKEIKNILNNKNLLKRIMDEAHRFAISYHRKIRRRELLTKI